MPGALDIAENRLGPDDMALIIQKFGGTSVADVERIKQAALRTQAEVDAGNQVVVVVSAMAGVTNALVEYTDQMETARKFFDEDFEVLQIDWNQHDLIKIESTHIVIKREERVSVDD